MSSSMVIVKDGMCSFFPHVLFPGLMDTPQHNAYVPGYKPAHIQHHAWRTVENSARYLIPHLSAMAQSKPTLQLLDVGAGPGSISVSLAKYIPQGTVTATDISEEVLKQASAYAQTLGCNNVQFQTADVYKLPFADHSFDIIHVSQVLGHLDDPVQALREMLRVCKPEGIVAVCEADMRTWVCYPDLPALHEFFKVMMDSMPRNNTGLRLISFALEAGAKRDAIEFTTGTYCFATQIERETLGGAFRERGKNGEMRRKAIEKGERTAEEFDEMVKAWDEWIASENACTACINGELVIRKTN